MKSWRNKTQRRWRKMGYADEFTISFWIEWYKADDIERKNMLEKLVELNQPIFLEPDAPIELKKKAFIALFHAYLEYLAEALEYYFEKGDIKKMSCKEYEEFVERKEIKIVVRMLDELLRKSEKAHPALPDTIEEIVCSGLGKCRNWLYMYYIPSEEASIILHKYKKKKKKHMKNLLSWGFFMWSPTSSRERFEEWKEKLKDCKTLDDIISLCKR